MSHYEQQNTVITYLTKIKPKCSPCSFFGVASSVPHMMNFVSLFFPVFPQFFVVCRISFIYSSPSTAFQSSGSLDFGWVMATPWWIFFSNHSVVTLLSFLGSLFWCMKKFQQNFSCQTDGFTFDSRILWYGEEFMVDSKSTRCPGPVAAHKPKSTPLYHCASHRG